MTETDFLKLLKSALREHAEETGEHGSDAALTEVVNANKRASDGALEVWKLGRSARLLKTILAIVIGLGGAAATGLTCYAGRIENGVREEVRIEADAKAHEVRTGHVNGEINRLDKSIEDVATELTEFTSDQRTENDATRARTTRTEVMVETLLRTRGRKPPKKTEARKQLDRKVGIDPDHPLK